MIQISKHPLAPSISPKFLARCTRRRGRTGKLVSRGAVGAARPPSSLLFQGPGRRVPRLGPLTPMSISPGGIADELKDFAGGVIGSADIRWEAVVSRWEAGTFARDYGGG